MRIAQGLVHMGKALAFISDQMIMSKPTVAGLLATLTVFTDVKACECLHG